MAPGDWPRSALQARPAPTAARRGGGKPTNVTITSNTVRNASGAGIVASVLSRFVIANNVVLDSSRGASGYSGIYVSWLLCERRCLKERE